MTKTILISFALVAFSAAVAAEQQASPPQQQPPPPPPAARAAQPPPPAARAAQPPQATRAQSAQPAQRSQGTNAPQAALKAAPCTAGSDCSETLKQIAREDQRREAQAREVQEQALRRAGSGASLCAQDACSACDGTCLRPAANAACACSRKQ
jgi:hypothetical protein